MNKRLATILIGFALFATPSLVSAQSNDMGTFINTLLKQIQELQQQLNDLLQTQHSGPAGDDTTTNAPEPSPTCPQLYLSRTLSLGMGGEDVRSLQNFLISQGFLAAGNNSGYFGRLTEAAVKVFQTKEGIEPVGIVGRLTRAAIVAHCSRLGTEIGTTPVNPTQPNTLHFTASPLAGAAPLTVAFSAQVSGGNYYSINYGDGTSAAMQSLSCTGGCNPFSISSNHTYTAPGTYTARLFDTRRDCASGSDCSVASVSVTVSTSQTGQPILSASPLSGVAPLSVQFSLTGMQGNTWHRIEFGDGTTNYLTQGSGLVSTTHSYTVPGTYSAKLYSAEDCLAGCAYGLVQTLKVTVFETNATTYTVSASASATTPGFVTGSWSTSETAASDDWVALVPQGTTWNQSHPTASLRVWATSNSKTKNNATASSGTVSFSSVPSGPYQLVYYLNTKGPDGNYIEKARSSTVSPFWGAD